LPIFVIGKLGGQIGVDLERIWTESAEFRDDFDVQINETDVLLTPLSSGTTGRFNLNIIKSIQDCQNA
jgi:hypothetical protein